MVQRQIELIGAAWGIGGADPACADAPGMLAPALAARLAARGVAAMPGPMLRAAGRERRKQAAVSRLCGLLGSAVADAMRRGRLPCVLGGDHSCAGGTWTGVARALREEARRSGEAGALGLLWIDAHMDCHTNGTSHTGRLHGMPLAWLLGQDDDPLYGLATGVVQPAHVALVGVRSFEPEEDERLRRLGVRVFRMDEVRARGLPAVFDEALRVATQGTSGFGVSIDLDALDPVEAPGVATPVAGGIRAAELAAALATLPAMSSFRALELVEYTPRLDPRGSTAEAAIGLLEAALCGPEEEPHVVAAALERHDR